MLPPDAPYIVNDGQHRIAGIAQALRENPDLAHDSISVVLLPDRGTQRNQQIFSDLNRTVQKTSRSLDILYDSRLPINRITLECVSAVPLFHRRTDKERVSLSVRNRNFATLSGLQRANTQLLGDIPEGADEAAYAKARDYAIEFWNRATQFVQPWSEIADGTMTSVESAPGLSVLIHAGAVGTRTRRSRAARARHQPRRPKPPGRRGLAQGQPRMGRHLHPRQQHHHPNIHT